MKASYSATANAVAIHIDPAPVGRVITEELAPGVYMDRDSEGKIVGFEFLNAQEDFRAAVLEQLGSAATWLTLVEASAEAKREGETISPSTLRVLIHKGRIPADVVRKIGTVLQIAQHGLWNYLESRAQDGRRATPPKARTKRVKRATAKP